MPENMSEKRKELIKNYGAELILTSEKDGMRGSIEKTKELLKNTSDLYYTDQFSNYASVLAHKLSTAPEIYRQLNGKVDILIMGIGTGATLLGIAEYFKHINRQTQIIGMLPKQYPHSIQGIGAGFKPPLLDYSVIDRIIMVNDLEAISEKDDILKTENLFVGISSGAVLAGLKKLLQDEDCSQKNIVVIFADGGERYI